MDAAAALHALFAPPTRRLTTNSAPKVRKSCCKKCPFGTGLTGEEQFKADMLKARLAGRLSAGEQVIWGCHETVEGRAPQVCAGFAEWTRPRPDLIP